MQKTLVALALILSVSFATLADFTVSSTGSATVGWQVNGKATDRIGSLITDIGDFNNDGFNDYAVAGTGQNVYVILGKASPGRAATLELTTAATTDVITITISGSNPPTALAAGDVNGDGVPDLAIAVPAALTAGRVFVVYGKSTTTWVAAGITNPLTITVATGLVNDQGFTVKTDGATGVNIAIGDFAHDSKADLIVGQTESNTNTGGVCVVYGKANLAASGSAQVSTKTARGDSVVDCTTSAKLQVAAGDTTTPGADVWEGQYYVGAANSRLGQAVAVGQDLNGDGYEDLFVAAAGSDAAYIVYGAANAAAGPPAAAVASVDLSAAAATIACPVTQPSAAAITTAAFIGNWNADANSNRNELALGAPGESTNKGIVYVIFGTGAKATATIVLSTMAATTGISYTGADTAGYFGYSLDGNQDVNNDGVPDLVVGAPLTVATRTTGTNAGKVYVIYGRAANTASVNLATTALSAATTGITITGVAVTGFGTAVSTTADINKDNIPDILVGAPSGTSASYATTGVVYELRGQKIDTVTVSGSGATLSASLLVLASFFVALMF